MQSVGQKQNLYISAVSFSLIVSAFAYVGLRREPRPFLPASEMPPAPKSQAQAAAPQQQGIPKLHRRVAGAPWKSELPNGVGVEIVAANDTPGKMGKWWTPGGERMPMQKRPYPLTPPETPPTHPLHRDNPPVSCELAVRLWVPEGKSYEVRSDTGVGYSPSFSASQSLYEPLPGGWTPITLRYMRGQPKTPLRIGVALDKGETQWVLFDNIALPPHDDDAQYAAKGKHDGKNQTPPSGRFREGSVSENAAPPAHSHPPPSATAPAR